MTQSAPVLGSEGFGNKPLHKIRYGIQSQGGQANPRARGPATAQANPRARGPATAQANPRARGPATAQATRKGWPYYTRRLSQAAF